MFMEMTIEEYKEKLLATRIVVADFLQKHLDNVRRLEGAKPGSLYMSDVVTRFNARTKCGTVCCMDGWLPNTFPEQFVWLTGFSGTFDGDVVRSFRKKDSRSTLGYCPIDEISISLWEFLTGVGSPLDCYDAGNVVAVAPICDFENMELTTDDDPERVFDVWEQVIAGIRAGVLDFYLNVLK
jgi:hypothetical protein